MSSIWKIRSSRAASPWPVLVEISRNSSGRGVSSRKVSSVPDGARSAFVAMTKVFAAQRIGRLGWGVFVEDQPTGSDRPGKFPFVRAHRRKDQSRWRQVGRTIDIDLPRCGIVACDGRSVDKLDLDILEPGHSGTGCGERIVGYDDVSVAQGPAIALFPQLGVPSRATCPARLWARERYRHGGRRLFPPPSDFPSVSDAALDVGLHVFGALLCLGIAKHFLRADIFPRLWRPL